MVTRTRSIGQLKAAGAVLAAALLLAACGNGGGDTSSTGSQNNSTTTKAAGATSGDDVATGKTPVGTVLVDAKGMTLYAFAADSPGKSNCSGSCASYWPPAPASGSVSHSADVSANLGTIKRSDGTTQLTVNDLPAYTYAGDSGPGQASGQGLNLSGGLWWALAPSGSEIKSGGSSSSSGGTDYKY